MSEGRIVDVQGDEKDPVSQGRLCAAGSAFVREVYRSDRIESLSSRKSLHDTFEEFASWEDALDLLADRLKKIRDQHGPEALLVSCDPAVGWDFYFAAKRFAALWGTPHVFSSDDEPPGSCVCEVPNAPDSSSCDWIHSRCFLVVGADPASTHPVVFRRILQAQRSGAKLVVADTRFTTTMSKADVPLRIRSHTANVLGTALMKAILDEESFDPDSMRDRFADADSWLDSWESVSLEAAGEATDLAARQLQEVARLLFKNSPVQLITGKQLSHLPGYGIWRTMAAVAGWRGTAGGGWYPLDSGRPPLNFAMDPHEEDSQTGAGSTRGNAYVSLADLFERIMRGDDDAPKAIICSGNALDHFFALVGSGSEAAPLTVHFGPVWNETSSHSHMLFPAQAWPERDSLFFSNDRAMRWGNKIVEPPDAARSGLDFWVGLSKRFGWQDRFPWESEEGRADHEAFCEWLLKENSWTKGCTPLVLKKASDNDECVTWPVEGTPSGQTSLTPQASASSGIALSLPATGEDLARLPDELYPLYLEVPDPACRAVLCVDHEALRNVPRLQINPETAEALGIQTNDEVNVHGHGWVVEARANLTRMVPVWLVYLREGVRQESVLVCKKGQSGQEARNILKELLS